MVKCQYSKKLKVRIKGKHVTSEDPVYQTLVYKLNIERVAINCFVITLVKVTVILRMGCTYN